MFYKIAKSAAFLLAIQLAVVAPLSAQRSSLAPQRSDLIPGITSSSNLFTPQQDIELGRALSQDAAVSFILSEDAATRGYIRTLGSELAARAPGYRYPWQFNVFIDPEIRSLALPGGYIYVSSGLVTAMQNEPQLASVLAHQIAHVAARHGTQQVSTRYSQLHAPLGRVTVNDAISRLNLTIDPDSPLSAFTTQAEQQADTIATQILYDSRFDPRLIPTAFQRLINQRDLSRDFVANHPTPANRTVAIRQELQRRGPLPASWRGSSTGFQTAQQLLRDESTIGLAGRIDDNNNPYAPSTRMTTYRGQDFDIQYPDNWRVENTSISVMLAREGGVVRGALAFGMLIDTFQPQSQNIFGRGGLGLGGRNSLSFPGGGQDIFATTTISTATDQLLDELRRSNPNMRAIRRSPKRVDGFEALTVELNNDSPLGGTEVNSLTTVLHSNGLLYYFLGVAPQSNYNQYSPAFDRMIDSIRFYLRRRRR
jgi:hypothetical protein